MESSALHIWGQLLSLPYGMMLVSGPTGSEKTTTLYDSVIQLVNSRSNIMTVEVLIATLMTLPVSISNERLTVFPVGL